MKLGTSSILYSAYRNRFPTKNLIKRHAQRQRERDWTGEEEMREIIANLWPLLVNGFAAGQSRHELVGFQHLTWQQLFPSFAQYLWRHRRIILTFTISCLGKELLKKILLQRQIVQSRRACTYRKSGPNWSTRPASVCTSNGSLAGWNCPTSWNGSRSRAEGCQSSAGSTASNSIKFINFYNCTGVAESFVQLSTLWSHSHGVADVPMRRTRSSGTMALRILGNSLRIRRMSHRSIRTDFFIKRRSTSSMTITEGCNSLETFASNSRRNKRFWVLRWLAAK